jgi:propanol-preferring alcohol dehydrogenase
MRALVLDRPAPAARSPLRLRTRGTPRPGTGELLVRVAACAVCRTDLQLCEGDLAARRLPIVPGHQAVGRVEAVGPEAEGWSVGDRLGIGWLASTCGDCGSCTAGRENLCPEARFTGWDVDGGFEELAVVKADFALRLPAGVTDRAAAPLLCGGVIGYRALTLSGIGLGGRLGLFGFGASALQAIQVARHWGCEVYVVTRSSAERERALQLGARWAGGYDEPVPVPLDAAVTFAPAGDVVVAALRALDRGGTVAINAIHLDRVPEFSYDLLWWERGLRSVANYTRQDAREYLELAATIPIRTVVERHPLENGNLALQRLKAGEVEGAAVLVTEAAG